MATASKTNKNQIPTRQMPKKLHLNLPYAYGMMIFWWCVLEPSFVVIVTTFHPVRIHQIPSTIETINDDAAQPLFHLALHNPFVFQYRMALHEWLLMSFFFLYCSYFYLFFSLCLAFDLIILILILIRTETASWEFGEYDWSVSTQEKILSRIRISRAHGTWRIGSTDWRFGLYYVTEIHLSSVTGVGLYPFTWCE